MRAKKMATAKRRSGVSRMLPLNTLEYAGITWVWGSDAVYHLHWRNAGRTPVARIFNDHLGGRIVLVEGSRKQKKFQGKNSERRAFKYAAAAVQIAILRKLAR